MPDLTHVRSATHSPFPQSRLRAKCSGGFVSFFGGPLLVPVVVLAAVTAYVLVFDKPELTGKPPKSQTTATRGDLGEQPGAA
jgi:hypothetical protein